MGPRKNLKGEMDLTGKVRRQTSMHKEEVANYTFFLNPGSYHERLTSSEDRQP